MQMSHTSRGIDLAAVAEASGFVETAVLRRLADVVQLTQHPSWHTFNGPRLFVLKIYAEPTQRSLPPRDAVFIKNRFRAHLGLDPN